MCDAAKPPEKRAPDEWADQERILPPGHSEPGPFRSRRTPYMIPLERAVNGPWKGVVGVMGSQMGKTDSIANIMGARLDDDPVPIIYLAPTRKFVEQTWEPRFVDMVDSSVSLSKKIVRGKTSSKTQKTIAGVKVSFSWAGSATSVAGEPAGIVVVDERDRMGLDVEGEGDPVALANARHSTYPDGKTFVFSTPLTGVVETYRHEDTGLEHWKMGDRDEIQSPTWRLWQSGTKHEWMWPCPHCDEYFAPRFKLLRWPHDIEPDHIDETNLCLVCPNCGAEIRESQKLAMNERGMDLAPGDRVVNGERVGPPYRSEWYTLWVSGLCSPWRSWVSNAREYARAEQEGDSETLQTVVNTRFGELYAISGEAPPWEDVAALRMPYPSGSVPEGATQLFLTVDVQKDSLYYIVRGWSRRQHLESWLIEHGQIYGDTNDRATWDELSEFRLRLFETRQITRCFVDQKYRTPQVFAFCTRHQNWAYPVAGRMPKSEDSEAQKPLRTSPIDVSARGKAMKHGLTRWTINTDFFKRWLHDRIALGPRGGFHIHQDATDEYCRQLVAEARVVKDNGRVTWLQLGPNHYLDCESMQVACAYSLRLQHYARPNAPAPTQPQAPPPAAREQQQQRSSGWMNRTGRWMR